MPLLVNLNRLGLGDLPVSIDSIQVEDGVLTLHGWSVGSPLKLRVLYGQEDGILEERVISQTLKNITKLLSLDGKSSELPPITLEWDMR